MKIVYSIIHFWMSNPALFYGVAFFLGLSCQIKGFISMTIPCLGLWIPLVIAMIKHKEIFKLLTLSLLTFFAAWFYAHIHYSLPFPIEQGINGEAQINIKNIRLHHTLFGEQWIYHSELIQFVPEDSRLSVLDTTLPCLICFPINQPRPLANQNYWVYGRLIQSKANSYRLKVSSKTTWNPIKNSMSFAESRYQWKQTMNRWIANKFHYPLSAHFLSGLVTGEFDDYWMRQQFSRFGLQHLLAISGFHFAIIASFFSLILRLLFSQRVYVIILLFCLGFYAFFLGPQPSILRSWMMCSLNLLAGLLEKQTTSLNLLGFALLSILGFNPLLSQELGFQLSFATTTAILLFYPLIRGWIDNIFFRKSLSQVIQMNQLNQHGYFILAFLRQAIALTIAVNIFALPLTIFYFQSFPLMSLLYNLFFPFLASISLLLLLLGAIFIFLPFIETWVDRLNDLYTYYILQLTYQLPNDVDWYINVNAFHFSFLIIYLSAVSLIGVVLRERYCSKSHSENFSFI